MGPAGDAEGKSHWPTVDEFVACIDYVAQLAGDSAHIGIGTDMSLGSYPPHETDPWGEPAYIGIADGVRPARDRRTFDHRGARSTGSPTIPRSSTWPTPCSVAATRDAQVHGILGHNYLRLFEQVWTQPGATPDSVTTTA